LLAWFDLPTRPPWLCSVIGVRTFEGQAAGLYFAEWKGYPLSWRKSARRYVPPHWQTVRERGPPLSDSARRAVDLANAILNDGYGVLEAPMQPPNCLVLYEGRLVSLWERLVTTLGIHTVRVLLDRAIWQTAQRYPHLALIYHDDAGLGFEALEQSYATRPQEKIEAAFTDLSAETLHILARLRGSEMAQHTCVDRADPRQSGAG
jgi:hypothetical protein